MAVDARDRGASWPARGPASGRARAPRASTRAAARYLRELYLEFGDWLLALAAYNAGEARVAAAIARAGTRDFRRLAAVGLLPEETRRYVPAVLLRMVANR